MWCYTHKIAIVFNHRFCDVTSPYVCVDFVRVTNSWIGSVHYKFTTAFDVCC